MFFIILAPTLGLAALSTGIYLECKPAIVIACISLLFSVIGILSEIKSRRYKHHDHTH